MNALHRILRFLRGAALAAACMTAAVPVFAAPDAVTIDITKFAFAPKEVTVEPGTRVIWINRDETPHTVASDDKSFVSKGLDTDDEFEHTFAAAGDFGYVCTVHPFMTGVVHVRKR